MVADFGYLIIYIKKKQYGFQNCSLGNTDLEHYRAGSRHICCILSQKLIQSETYQPGSSLASLLIHGGSSAAINLKRS